MGLDAHMRHAIHQGWYRWHDLRTHILAHCVAMPASVGACRLFLRHLAIGESIIGGGQITNIALIDGRDNVRALFFRLWQWR